MPYGRADLPSVNVIIFTYWSTIKTVHPCSLMRLCQPLRWRCTLAEEKNNGLPRLLILGLVGIVIVFGLVLVVQTIAVSRLPAQDQETNALAASQNECVLCHRETTPGIVIQFGHSAMAAAEVTCQDCHEVGQNYPGSAEHEGTYVLSQPTPARCEKCHAQEVAQFSQSRHGLPAYVAYAGSVDLDAALIAQYESIPEGGAGPDKMRNALYALEGAEVTQFACEACHNIGKPNADGSAGDCTKCHLRHEFSLTQVRKPETCNYCHIGPDHPQWEIYQESPHGIAYATGGAKWAWAAGFPRSNMCHLSLLRIWYERHKPRRRRSAYMVPLLSD
jgi:hydroxylamine dehydrogenase